jgi:signal transduction histidine kinase
VAQQSMVASQKLSALGGLTAGIAHEINNPMRMITTYSEITQEVIERLCDLVGNYIQFPDSAAEGEFQEMKTTLASNLERIQSQGKKVSDIVSAMLAHARERDESLETMMWYPCLAPGLRSGDQMMIST